jgi:hypothetical protein
MALIEVPDLLINFELDVTAEAFTLHETTLPPFSMLHTTRFMNPSFIGEDIRRNCPAEMTPYIKTAPTSWPKVW